jgi:hypothetical protein
LFRGRKITHKTAPGSYLFFFAAKFQINIEKGKRKRKYIYSVISSIPIDWDKAVRKRSS